MLFKSTFFKFSKINFAIFFEPLGFVPESLVNSSPLAYGKYEIIDSHTANIVRINEKIEKMNYSSKLKERFIRNRYSSKSVEIKNNSNII